MTREQSCIARGVKGWAKVSALTLPSGARQQVNRGQAEAHRSAAVDVYGRRRAQRRGVQQRGGTARAGRVPRGAGKDEHTQHALEHERPRKALTLPIPLQISKVLEPLQLHNQAIARRSRLLSAAG